MPETSFRINVDRVRMISVQSADFDLLPRPTVNSSLRDLPADRVVPNGDHMIPIGGDVYVPASDVVLVMAQTGVPRHLAARALRTHGGDIVNAIMWLVSYHENPPESEPDETVMTRFLQQMFEDHDLYT